MSRLKAVARALALCAAVLLGLFLAAEPACAHSGPESSAGRVERVERIERAEPKREGCPAQRSDSGSFTGVLIALPGSPYSPSSPRSRSAAFDSPADADPGTGRAAPVAAPRAARQAIPLSRSGELPVAHQVFRC
ncbi:hypothetical protein ACFXJ5_35950 [Streptomyces sp. NPDC059373]